MNIDNANFSAYMYVPQPSKSNFGKTDRNDVATVLTHFMLHLIAWEQMMRFIAKKIR